MRVRLDRRPCWGCREPTRMLACQDCREFARQARISLDLLTIFMIQRRDCTRGHAEQEIRWLHT